MDLFVIRLGDAFWPLTVFTLYFLVAGIGLGGLVGWALESFQGVKQRRRGQ